MTKKECFFVWRGCLGANRLLAHVAPNARMSRLALEVAVLDLDPFQLVDLAGRNAALAELARIVSAKKEREFYAIAHFGAIGLYNSKRFGTYADALVDKTTQEASGSENLSVVRGTLMQLASLGHHKPVQS